MACILTSDLYVSIVPKRLIHILPNVNKRQVNIVLKYLDVMSAFLISLLPMAHNPQDGHLSVSNCMAYDPQDGHLSVSNCMAYNPQDGHLSVSNCKMVLVLLMTAALEMVN